jgi:hypothetical protein
MWSWIDVIRKWGSRWFLRFCFRLFFPNHLFNRLQNTPLGGGHSRFQKFCMWLRRKEKKNAGLDGAHEV